MDAMVKTVVLSDNVGETLKARWDGVRFALVVEKLALAPKVIVLNPQEMLELIRFAGSIGEQAVVGPTV